MSANLLEAYKILCFSLIKCICKNMGLSNMGSLVGLPDGSVEDGQPCRVARWISGIWTALYSCYAFAYFEYSTNFMEVLGYLN